MGDAVGRSSAIGHHISLSEVQADMDLFREIFSLHSMTAGATFLALIIGIPFGYFLWRKTEYGVAYEMACCRVCSPTVLLYPLFLVIFGRSHATLIAMGFIPGAIP